ncbi:GH36-type glycosyl hydrolase domain-containing protein [Microlunatus sp. GCM10028923]|uniref:GH36-type glycosyl hydrolase domain-containing protein n=1 Tax=Microlunatus sp. GCM10028923 TaxID=3273400 RepID=UPI00360AD670
MPHSKTTPRSEASRLVLDAGGGITAEVYGHGGLGWLSAGDLRLNLYPASEVEPGQLNLWLRIHAGDRTVPYPLLGPGTGATVRRGDRSMIITGAAGGLDYRVTFRLVPDRPAWSWTVDLTNPTAEVITADVIMAQDAGLAGHGEVRASELYVSQYVDLQPLHHPEHGWALAVRQNQPRGGRIPWLLLACTDRATGYATDALQLYGLEGRIDGRVRGLERRELPSTRLQHEHALAVLGSAPHAIEPGATHTAGFVGVFRDDHPDASAESDLEVVAPLVTALRQAQGAEAGALETTATATLFAPARPVVARDLTEAELAGRYGDDRRLAEHDDQGRLLSFFLDGPRHVVLAAKERTVLRPHGQLLRTGDRLLPDPAGLTVTTWMNGSPLSYLTQAHASSNRLLSTNRGYLGQLRDHGLRVFVELDGSWRLLGLPSAYELSPDRCRWTYLVAGADGDTTLELITVAPADDHRVTLTAELTGPARRFLITGRLATDGDDGRTGTPAEVERAGAMITIRPPAGSALAERYPGGAFTVALGDTLADAELADDGALHEDGRSRGDQHLTVITPDPVDHWSLTITAALHPNATTFPEPVDGQAAPGLVLRQAQDTGSFWAELAGRTAIGGSSADGVDRLDHALPWMIKDALVHYLSPRGLEQSTGGAWGTRDVTQGPAELLLALGADAELRELLIMLMAAQNRAGDWPQAFGFFEEDRDFRHSPPHGDVIFWPVLALGRYLETTGDASLLDAEVPWFDDQQLGTVLDHALAALATAAGRVLPGTVLTAYGHGDWNDSLQPADPAMAEELVSSWTVTLHHQTLSVLANGLTVAGRADHAEPLRQQAEEIATAFRHELIIDETLTGYARFVNGRRTQLLVHPQDRESGLTYSLLPIIHALIDDLLDPAQAAQHVRLIKDRLLAPDGARLFDAPPRYAGGTMTHFQRAETATFVGREIGIMYTHAHLRYAEAMARWGDPEAVWAALQQVINIAPTEWIPNARPRQANTYASSSDAVVADRAEFAARYADVMAGRIEVEGGWRTYSSGAGIFVRLVRESLLGLRRRAGTVELDPVLTTELDGLTTTLRLADDHRLTVIYRVGKIGYGPSEVRLDGAPLPATRLTNPYRTGGLAVRSSDLPTGSTIEVILP